MALNYLGNVVAWAPNYAPQNWMFCKGQLLPIANYTALYSLVGNYYGGDGRTTFALPDLQGRMVVGEGNGPGITTKILGRRGGVETDQLDIMHIPTHGHSAVSNMSLEIQASSSEGNSHVPQNNDTLASFGAPDFGYVYNGYNSEPANIVLNGGNVSGQVELGYTGGNNSHYNMMPYSVLNYIICVNGIYPSRS
ncbi:phage tail protein [Roseivirga sp. BDSF3-8]|uniref:phage tail protein n=1 Tax=Roseivirga sp. BDSF3-8 TaxID=3241598 RepID=UPI0035319D93